ncbi:hypothetical protein Vretimale_16816, partial [Volvox reticuliferus]
MTPRSKRSRRSTLRRLIMLVSIRCSAEMMTVLESLEGPLPPYMLGQPAAAAAEVVQEIFSVGMAVVMMEARGARIRWAVVIGFVEPNGCDGTLGTTERSVSTVWMWVGLHLPEPRAATVLCGPAARATNELRSGGAGTFPSGSPAKFAIAA